MAAAAEEALAQELFGLLDSGRRQDWRPDLCRADRPAAGPSSTVPRAGSADPDGRAQRRTVPEIAPARYDAADTAGLRVHLAKHGFACVEAAASPAELCQARELLWAHLEGRDCPGPAAPPPRRHAALRQSRPVGWRRGEPTTWQPPRGWAAGPLEGHSDAGLMTSTTHCDALWSASRLLPHPTPPMTAHESDWASGSKRFCLAATTGTSGRCLASCGASPPCTARLSWSPPSTACLVRPCPPTHPPRACPP